MRNLISVGVLLALAACTPTTVAVQGNFRAQDADASQLRNIAVAQFVGRYGGAFAGRLTTALAAAKTGDGHPYFTIAAGVPQLAQSLGVATSYGRARSVSGVYFGETEGGVSYQSYQERRMRCISDGKKSCAQQQEYVVGCTKASARFTAYPKVVDVRSGILKYSATVSGAADQSWCQDNVRSGTDEDLMGAAINQAVQTVRRAVAPYTLILNVPLMTHSDALKGPAADQFKGAVEFAQQGRLDRACAIWESMSQQTPDVIELIYDRGVCAEANGDFRSALKLYTQADSKLTAPNKMVSDALDRIRKLIARKE